MAKVAIAPATKIPSVVVERTSVPIRTLKAASYNPRKMNPAAMAGLEKSVAKFGLVQDIVVNKRNMTVVGGHQRLSVLKKLKERTAPVVFVDLDDADEKLLNVTLNNPAVAGDWDGRLADLLAELQTGRDDTLFYDLRLDELLEDAEKARKKHVEFDVNGEARTDELGGFEFSVIVRAENEAHQAKLLERFEAEGLSVKALTL
jgi:ParB-like chromosome segregation protein Spo0J